MLQEWFLQRVPSLCPPPCWQYHLTRRQGAYPPFVRGWLPRNRFALVRALDCPAWVRPDSFASPSRVVRPEGRRVQQGRGFERLELRPIRVRPQQTALCGKSERHLKK